MIRMLAAVPLAILAASYSVAAAPDCGASAAWDITVGDVQCSIPRASAADASRKVVCAKKIDLDRVRLTASGKECKVTGFGGHLDKLYPLTGRIEGDLIIARIGSKTLVGYRR